MENCCAVVSYLSAWKCYEIIDSCIQHGKQAQTVFSNLMLDGKPPAYPVTSCVNENIRQNSWTGSRAVTDCPQRPSQRRFAESTSTWHENR